MTDLFYDDYDYDDSKALDHEYIDANLKVGSSGDIEIEDIVDIDPYWLQYCTPVNCSKLFWTKLEVIGDEDYFTLENYNVKPGLKIATNIFRHGSCFFYL